MSVYFALVQSHIAYGIALWGSCNVQLMNKIMRLQKRAVRYLCGLSRQQTVRSHFKLLDILTASSLYVLEVCLSVRRLENHHTYSTRHRDVVEITVHRTVGYESGSLYRGLKIYIFRTW